jgi:hypothetical protein
MIQQSTEPCNGGCASTDETVSNRPAHSRPGAPRTMPADDARRAALGRVPRDRNPRLTPCSHTRLVLRRFNCIERRRHEMASRYRVCRALLSYHFVGTGHTLPPNVGASCSAASDRPTPTSAHRCRRLHSPPGRATACFWMRLTTISIRSIDAMALRQDPPQGWFRRRTNAQSLLERVVDARPDLGHRERDGDRNKDGDWTLPTPSAFGADEIESVRRWVAGGGSLLLMPITCRLVAQRQI